MVTALRGDRPKGNGRIRSTCSVVSLSGIDTYRTPALSAHDATWFADHGFTTMQTLVVLQRHGGSTDHLSPLLTHDEKSARQVLSARHMELCTALLAIDAASFPSPWNLTATSFHHACAATREHRVLIASNDAGTPVGFAIVGRVGTYAYLQRLAVLPMHRRSGVGRSLVHLASQWATTRGASTMLVNTEPTNTGALALYAALGFVVLPDPLFVLERPVHVLFPLPTGESAEHAT